MLRQIIKKEFPLRHSPKPRHLVIIEANHESSDDIEFLSKTRQGTKRIDLLNDAVHTEQTRDFPEHRHAVYVEANSGMTEELRDIEKIPCAATQIENVLGTRHVEFKLTDAPNVHSDPTVKVKILRPVRAGIRHRVSPANLFELYRIYCLNDALCL